MTKYRIVQKGDGFQIQELQMKDMLDQYPHKADQIVDPQWGEAQKVHDWRNHVPDEIAERWGELSEETHVCVWFMANEAASREEWE